QTWVVSHPLVGPIARALLWRGLTGQGLHRCFFRVTEDRAWVGADEMPVEADGLERVALAHPVYLSADELHAWQRVFIDHEQTLRGVMFLSSGAAAGGGPLDAGLPLDRVDAVIFSEVVATLTGLARRTP